MKTIEPSPVLPDVLEKNLRVVFCGTAPGKRSAERKAYYAHPSNRFWATLHKTGLTTTLLRPEDFWEVLQYGIGLTDLCKTESGSDKSLSRGAFKREHINEVIKTYAPRVIAFTSKEAAKGYLFQNVNYGPVILKQEETIFFVLPSPSGLATRYWDASYWHQLASLVTLV